MEIKDLISIPHTFGIPVYVYDANKISSEYELCLALGSTMQ